MRRLLVVIAALVMLPVGSIAQEGRSELSLQGTGFFTTPAAWEPSSEARKPVDSLWDTVITLTVGLRWKAITVTTEIRRSILAVSENRESKPTCTQ
jgi:hypothetical protein